MGAISPRSTTYDPSSLDPPAAKVVELQDVVKKFGSKTVLNGVSLSIEPGSVFALLGENGAGKTTTIRMILGETAPTNGVVRVFDRDPLKDFKEVRERIGVIPETPTLYEYMTVEQIGRFASAFNRRGYLRRYAELCEELELNPKSRIKTLSKGMKAKASLALELARDPEILVPEPVVVGIAFRAEIAHGISQFSEDPHVVLDPGTDEFVRAAEDVHRRQIDALRLMALHS